ncbi:hypothetical protein VTN96DRAFT_6930 [Rasamsonia emersonii]
MGTTDHGSGATTAARSGRRVAHSRGGCLTCKRRRLRCPENKPVLERQQALQLCLPAAVGRREPQARHQAWPQ